MGDEEKSKLWTPPKGVDLLRLRHRAKKVTVTLPNGKRALVTVSDNDVVTQIESAERLDAIVRPQAVRLVIRPGRD